jgi:hypothetical protein
MRWDCVSYEMLKNAGVFFALMHDSMGVYRVRQRVETITKWSVREPCHGHAGDYA